MNDTKICPICVAGVNDYVNYCIREKCAWWAKWANDCSIPIIGEILADSEICRTVFPPQEENK